MEAIQLQFLTLEEIKKQARVEADFTEEDDYLFLLGRAAERKLLSDLSRSYEDVVSTEGEWPENLTLAALLLTALWYQHREPITGQSLSVVPYGYEALYMPFRKGTYSSTEE